MPNITRTSLRLECLICLLLCNNITFAASSEGCLITSNTLAFGNYDVFATSPLNSTGTIKVRCSPGNTQYTVSLNNGLYGPITNRRMRSATGNQALNYNLYIDPSYSTVWGDGTGGSVTVTRARSDDLTVYGRLPPLQDIGVGTYSDIITVTVDF